MPSALPNQQIAILVINFWVAAQKLREALDLPHYAPLSVDHLEVLAGLPPLEFMVDSDFVKYAYADRR